MTPKRSNRKLKVNTSQPECLSFRSASPLLTRFLALLKVTPVCLSQKRASSGVPSFLFSKTINCQAQYLLNHPQESPPISLLWETEFIPSKPILCSFPSDRVLAGHRAGKLEILCLPSLVTGIRHINYQDTNTGLSYISQVFQGLQQPRNQYPTEHRYWLPFI